MSVFLLQVSDWWEEYIYLRSRSPIMVNSNFYIMVRNLDTLSGGHTKYWYSVTVFCVQ